MNDEHSTPEKAHIFEKPYYTCILWSPSARRVHIPLPTHDPGESLQQHNLGSYKDTAPHRPWKLLHRRRFERLEDAQTWETKLKAADEQGLIELTGLDPALLGMQGK